MATEVAVLRFLRFYTSITMVIRYDDTTDNLLGQEFTLLAKAPGMRVDQIQETINPLQRLWLWLLVQMTDYLKQLNEIKWDAIGSIH